MQIGELNKLATKFQFSVAFRVVNALLCHTFFQPDEFFQAWEPAWKDVYGTGFLSWEWQAQIRTSLMPRLFALIIRLSDLCSLDHLLVAKLVMAVLAATADVATSYLPVRVLPRRLATQQIQQIAWIVSLGSFFNWFCSTRPFSNTVEMVLVVCAIDLWQTENLLMLFVSQVLAHLAIALRPSNGLFWLLLGVLTVYKARNWSAKLKLIIFSAVVAIVAQGSILLMDMNYYGSYRKLPIVEFLRHNFGSHVSEIYGVMPWHFYFSQGVPFLLLGYLPFLVSGWSMLPRPWQLLLIINLLAFSAVAHKEFRFVYYLLPLLHVVIALGMQCWLVRRWLIRVAFIINIVVGGYFSMVHQRGVVDVVQYIRMRPSITEVTFLMPCHSTPWMAHFARRDKTFNPQFLTCEPPWNRSAVGYVDEADQFYLNPSAFLNEHPTKLTAYVAVFEPLLPLMKELGYHEIESFYNGLFSEDPRREGRVYLLSQAPVPKNPERPKNRRKRARRT